MQNSDIDRLARAHIAQITGGMMADIIALQTELSVLRIENARLQKEAAEKQDVGAPAEGATPASPAS